MDSFVRATIVVRTTTQSERVICCGFYFCRYWVAVVTNLVWNCNCLNAVIMFNSAHIAVITYEKSRRKRKQDTKYREIKKNNQRWIQKKITLNAEKQYTPDTSLAYKLNANQPKFIEQWFCRSGFVPRWSAAFFLFIFVVFFAVADVFHLFVFVSFAVFTIL